MADMPYEEMMRVLKQRAELCRINAEEAEPEILRGSYAEDATALEQAIKLLEEMRNTAGPNCTSPGKRKP